MKKLLVVMLSIGLFSCGSLKSSSCCDTHKDCVKQTECCGMDHCDKNHCEGNCCDSSCCR